MNNDNIKLSTNFIIADSDYADRVAFNLIVNFERMLNRRIPAASLDQWLVDIALDGGMRKPAGDTPTQVVLVHDTAHTKLDNFSPSVYDSDINRKAFKDNTPGEFAVNAIAVGSDIVSKETYITELIKTVNAHPEVERLMIIPDSEDEETFAAIRKALDGGSPDRRTTLFAMQPLAPGQWRQEVLGYSLMNAMGIKGSELHGGSSENDF